MRRQSAPTLPVTSARIGPVVPGSRGFPKWPLTHRHDVRKWILRSEELYQIPVVGDVLRKPLGEYGGFFGVPSGFFERRAVHDWDYEVPPESWSPETRTRLLEADRRLADAAARHHDAAAVEETFPSSFVGDFIALFSPLFRNGDQDSGRRMVNLSRDRHAAALRLADALAVGMKDPVVWRELRASAPDGPQSQRQFLRDLLAGSLLLVTSSEELLRSQRIRLGAKWITRTLRPWDLSFPCVMRWAVQAADRTARIQLTGRSRSSPNWLQDYGNGLSMQEPPGDPLRHLLDDEAKRENASFFEALRRAATPRERHYLDLSTRTRNLCNRQLAERMNVTEGTIRVFRYQLVRKAKAILVTAAPK